MRPFTQCISMFAAAVAITAASPMSGAGAADAFLKLGGVKPVLSKVEGGEAPGSARIGQEVVVQVESWSWGATGAEKFGAVGGMHRDDGVVSPRDSASGLATGKRQHGWVTVSKPLDRGAVRVKVKFPWLDCRVGAAFPDAVLQNDAGRYEFEDALISGCAPDSVTLDYAKVVVRGWDPAKK